MKSLIVMFLLAGCTSLPPVRPKETKYKVGDCLMILDLPNGQTTSPYRVRIEYVDKDRYWYRWLLDGSKWASGVSSGVGRFNTLEKISKKVDDCPQYIPEKPDKSFIKRI